MQQETSRTWLITGADKGLGLSTAKAALEQGDKVIVTVLEKDGGHVLSDQYKDRFRAIHLDMLDNHRIGGVVAQAAEAFGRIDVLVNNAGYGLISVAEETPAEKYRPLFEVNFFSLVEMTHAVLPYMRRQRGGHIINLSSTAGFAAAAGFGFYSATKFAVEGYSEALAKEVAHLGIHVTIIEPGGFRSDFAGGSLGVVKSGIPDYAEAGKMIEDYAVSRHGTQANDPAKFGPAMCALAAAARPPLRLPLGIDGLAYVRGELASVAADLEGWQELSHSVAFTE